MTKIQCPDCQKVLWGSNQGVCARMLGVHRRFKHGVVGAHFDRNKKHNSKQAKQVPVASESQTAAATIARWRGKPLMMDAVSVARRQAQAGYRAARKAKLLGLPAPQFNGGPVQGAERVKMNECPCCGARFYAVRGDA